jgi:hypothetical protein
MLERVLIIGGPGCGKSTFASNMGVPHYCGDPRSLVKRTLPNVNYLPEGLDWSFSSTYIAKNWFPLNGPWVIEGVSVVRALRKWAEVMPNTNPADKIIYFINPHLSFQRSTGQDSMEKAIATVWSDISNKYAPITTYKKWG